jgi:hypothetical protein
VLGGLRKPLNMKGTMDTNKQVHQWSGSDRMLHLLPAIPLIVFYVGTIYLLALHSIFLVAVFILLWIFTNFSVTRICAGCPYRGSYCPGICQLFIAPFLSLIIFKDGRGKSDSRSFKVDLVLLGVFGIGSYVFAFYWLFVLYWIEYTVVILVLLGSLLLYMPLSLFLLCPKCGYNDICPMAKVHKIFKNGGKSNGG